MQEDKGNATAEESLYRWRGLRKVLKRSSHMSQAFRPEGIPGRGDGMNIGITSTAK